MGRPRIILLDDHVFLLDAMKEILTREFDVVGTFSNGRAFLDAVVSLDPAVVILDIGMPGMSGLSACTQLKSLLPKVKTIFLTMNLDRVSVAEAFRSGADGYVLKTSAVVELVQAIRTVVRGGNFISPDLTEGIVGSPVQKFKKMKPHGLTRRQTEVLRLFAEGLPIKDIAAALNITPRTVAFHRTCILEELNLHSTAELIAYGVKQSLLSK